jgi:hypothetical protein
LAKLDKEEEQAIATFQETIAKILRLRKEKTFLKVYKRKIIEARLGSLNELDTTKEKERLKKEQVKQASLEANPSEVNFSIFELPPISDSELSV